MHALTHLYLHSNLKYSLLDTVHARPTRTNACCYMICVSIWKHLPKCSSIAMLGNVTLVMITQEKSLNFVNIIILQLIHTLEHFMGLYSMMYKMLPLGVDEGFNYIIHTQSITKCLNLTSKSFVNNFLLAASNNNNNFDWFLRKLEPLVCNT